MHGWLLGIDGVVKGKRFGIPARGIKIGRGKRVQILIEDENVSNTHAWVGVEKNRVIVRDQGSTNGTFINDPDSKPIKEARLSEGRRLSSSPANEELPSSCSASDRIDVKGIDVGSPTACDRWAAAPVTCFPHSPSNA